MKIEHPQILVASIGEETLPAEEVAIYLLYSHVTEFKAPTLAAFEAFMDGKRFDVVHLKVRFDEEGEVDKQSGMKVFQWVLDAQARLVIFATANPLDHYINAFLAERRRQADTLNLVMTLDRRGDLFPRFFKTLFYRMSEGQSLQKAWLPIPAFVLSAAPLVKLPMPDFLFEPNQDDLEFVPETC